MDHRFIDTVIFTCESCGWQGTVHINWSDVKPARCPGAKCKTSFLKNPELLKVTVPTMTSAPVEQEAPKYVKKKKK